MADFNWKRDGFFIRLYPNTKAAEAVWNEINKHFPNCDIPLSAYAGVSLQIRRAGYTLRKLPKQRRVNDGKLLAELLA